METQTPTQKARREYAAERARVYTDALLRVDQPLIGDREVSDLLDKVTDAISNCAEEIDRIAQGG